jgi:hypothetical protein
MVLQRCCFFETNSRLQKLPYPSLFSHSFIPSSFSSWLFNHFFPTMRWSAASRIHVFAFPTTASPFFKLTFYCSMSHNWHPEFRHIQIDRRTCTVVGSTLQFYFFVTSKQHLELRYIQIDRYSKLQWFLDHTLFRITIHLSCPFLCYTFLH